MPKPKGKLKPKKDAMQVDRKKRKAAVKGRRVRTRSEGTSLVQSGRAVVTPSDQPMIPFRNSGLITPPPLMQIPSGLTRMSQMGIPASMFANDPMSTGYFQAAPPTTQQQVSAGWSPLYKAQAGQEIAARENKQRTVAEEIAFRKKMNDLNLDPNNPHDLNLYYQYESEEAQRRLEEFQKKDKDAKMKDAELEQTIRQIIGADIGHAGMPMNDDQKYDDRAAEPAVSSSSSSSSGTPMGPILNPAQQPVLNPVQQPVLQPTSYPLSTQPVESKKRKADQQSTELVVQPSRLDLSNQLVEYRPLPQPEPVESKRPKSGPRPNPVYPALEYDPNSD